MEALGCLRENGMDGVKIESVVLRPEGVGTDFDGDAPAVPMGAFRLSAVLCESVTGFERGL